MTWQTDDVTAVIGAPAAAFLSPASHVFEGTQHVIYLGFTDNHIHELWWDDSGRHTEDLTAAAGAPLPGAGPLAAYAFEAQGTQHVIYEDANAPDLHIHELWSDATGWHTDDLTAATGAPPSGNGFLAGYAFEAQGTHHVIYQDANNRDPHIHELWSDPSGWHTDDLTAASGAPPPNGGSLAAYVSEAQGTQHVIYTAGLGDDHIQDLWWDNTGRHTDDLTAATGAPRGTGPFVAYAFEAQGTRHVIYINDRDEHVYELWWDGNGPRADDLTAASGAEVLRRPPHRGHHTLPGRPRDSLRPQPLSVRPDVPHQWTVWRQTLRTPRWHRSWTASTLHAAVPNGIGNPCFTPRPDDVPSSVELRWRSQ
jgi:hypothetical protein